MKKRGLSTGTLETKRRGLKTGTLETKKRGLKTGTLDQVETVEEGKTSQRSQKLGATKKRTTKEQAARPRAEKPTKAVVKLSRKGLNGQIVSAGNGQYYKIKLL